MSEFSDQYKELDKWVEEFELSIYDCERLSTLGRRRMNLEERLEYLRLCLNREKESPEKDPFFGLGVITSFLFEYLEDPSKWEEIDMERQREDNDPDF